MAATGLTDGRGYFSDDSEFYGIPLFQRANNDPYSYFQATRKDKLHFISNAVDHSQDLTSIQTSSDLGDAGELASSANGQAISDTVETRTWREHGSAWQYDEDIVAFLRRLPVDDPSTPTWDGWLWVDNPKRPEMQKSKRKQMDLNKFESKGSGLIDEYVKQHTLIANQSVGKAPATITRKMVPHRESLESDILALAVESGITSGKWMLFPEAVDLPRYWRIVATATSEGRLGPMSKSAVYNPMSPDTLICIYTHDFTDINDVRRVLEQLVDLGLCQPEGKPIHYKCDAYTHLHLTSRNEYKLRASLYSSREILRNEVKTRGDDGPVARMKKRNHRDDEAPSFRSMFAEDLA